MELKNLQDTKKKFLNRFKEDVCLDILVYASFFGEESDTKIRELINQNEALKALLVSLELIADAQDVIDLSLIKAFTGEEKELGAREERIRRKVIAYQGSENPRLNQSLAKQVVLDKASRYKDTYLDGFYGNFIVPIEFNLDSYVSSLTDFPYIQDRVKAFLQKEYAALLKAFKYEDYKGAEKDRVKHLLDGIFIQHLKDNESQFKDLLNESKLRKRFQSAALSALNWRDPLEDRLQQDFYKYLGEGTDVERMHRNASFALQQSQSLKVLFTERVYTIDEGNIKKRQKGFNYPSPYEIKNSNQLLNVNCHNVLNLIAKHITADMALESTVLARVLKYCDDDSIYDPKFAYGDLYTEFMRDLEANIHYDANNTFQGYYRNTGEDKKTPLENDFNNLVEHVYRNKNQALNRTYDVIRDAIEEATRTKDSIKSKVSSRLDGSGSKVNELSPSDRETWHQRGRDTFVRPKGIGSLYDSRVDPQNTTSLISEIGPDFFSYLEGDGPIHLRMGTQAQFLRGEVRVAPLMHRYLEIQATKDPNKKITHVYFNDLGLDRDDFEGINERNMSQALTGLEARHPNVAVIILPSDKGLLSHDEVHKTDATLVKDAVFNDLLAIAEGTGDTTRYPVQDFFISEKVRKLLFNNLGDEDLNTVNQKTELTRLLNESFEALRLDGKENISPAERQAVWFHFTKYKLTDFILTKLNPYTFNISCKDGIDRAGVHSLYYHLMKSFESDKPMTRKEFERALHATPALVKARGVNKHLDIIWNAVNQYLTKYPELKDHPQKKWLVDWRDDNVPVERQLSRVKEQLESHQSADNGLYKALRKGVLKYLESMRADKKNQLGFFKKRFKSELLRGQKRAEFYQQMLDLSKDNELGVATLGYALLATHDGNKMKAMVEAELRESLDIDGSVTDFLREQLVSLKPNNESYTETQFKKELNVYIKDIVKTANNNPQVGNQSYRSEYVSMLPELKVSGIQVMQPPNLVQPGCD